MSINNREDANRYYDLVNKLVDNYTDKWKIKPSSLKNYLKPGSERFKNFIKRNKLENVNGISQILNDVIDDRYHMESDGVITFENFKFFESEEFKIQSMKQSLYKGIEKADIKMEKILADHFDTNLGEIDVVDADKHTFKLNDWEGDDRNVIIYSKEELDIITSNITDYLCDTLSKTKVKLTDKIEIDLSDLVKKDKFSEEIGKKFTEEFLIETITDCLGDDYKFKSKVDTYFIWIS